MVSLSVMRDAHVAPGRLHLLRVVAVELLEPFLDLREEFLSAALSVVVVLRKLLLRLLGLLDAPAAQPLEPLFSATSSGGNSARVARMRPHWWANW